MSARLTSKTLRRLTGAAGVVLLVAGCGGRADAPAADAAAAPARTQASDPARTADHGLKPTLVAQTAALSSESARHSVYGNYLAGQFANKRGDLPAATRFLGKALERDPDNPELLRQTFLLTASIGEMDRALKLARRMADTPAEHSAATVLRALAEAKRGNYDAATTELDGLPEHGLSQLLDPLLAGWIAQATGNEADQIAALDPLNAIDGVDLLRQLHMALIHDLAERPEAARKSYEAALETADTVTLRLAWLAANFHVRQGDTAAAETLLDRFEDANPNTPTTDVMRQRLLGGDPEGRPVATAQQGMAEALFNLAGLLNQQGARELALIHARLALYVRPEFDFGRMLLAEILENQQRGAAALDAYRDIAPESPFHDTAQLRIASQLQSLDRTDEAIALLESMARKRDGFEPLYRLGNVHRGEENFDAAAGAYRKALNRLGETQEQHWTLHYFLGIALERTDRWDAAETQFKRALELRPEQPYVMNYLAYSWVEQKTNLDKAQAMLRRAVEQRPEDGFIVDSLGWVYYRLEQYDKAVKYLERAVELRPTDPVINDHLGDAYWKVGRKQEARYQWHRAKTLDPDDDVLAQIETKLEEGLEAADGPNG